MSVNRALGHAIVRLLSAGVLNDNLDHIGHYRGPAGKTWYLLFHDSEEIGPRMLARLAKTTGLKPEDL